MATDAWPTVRPAQRLSVSHSQFSVTRWASWDVMFLLVYVMYVGSLFIQWSTRVGRPRQSALSYITLYQPTQPLCQSPPCPRKPLTISPYRNYSNTDGETRPGIYQDAKTRSPSCRFPRLAGGRRKCIYLDLLISTNAIVGTYGEFFRSRTSKPEHATP